MHKFALKFSILFFIVISFGLSQSQAQTDTESIAEYSPITFDVNTLSEPGKKAYQKLLDTKIFTLSGYGVAAAPYPSTVALADLLKEKHVEKALQSLVRNATTEGQIYALLGLQIMKSKSFAADFAIFKRLSQGKEAEPVSSESGGGSPFEVDLRRAEVLEKLEKGTYAQTFRFVFGIKK